MNGYIEKYLLLFSDSIFSSLIFIFDKEIAIHVMKLDLYANRVLLLVITLFGVLVGSFANNILGRVIRKGLDFSLNKESIFANRARIATATLEKYWYIFVIPSHMDMYFKFFTFFLGFCGIKNYKRSLFVSSFIRSAICYLF